ncbi:elongator complex protein 6-like [Sycon ciliatum]|uniref:elongator complex protein 6-like n=1 Tax=Sycon ciliatum TaxID=27933 RepID=UPI0031F62A0C
MFTDLKWLLDISGRDLPRGFSLLSDDGVDGQFLMYFYLTLFLDGPGHVCLVATSSTFARLSAVAQKLGVDLASCVSQGRLVVIDCYSHLLDGVVGCSSPKVPNEPHVHKSVMLEDVIGRSALRPVYEIIAGVLRTKPAEKWCILIENSSQLLSAGCSADAVLNLLHYCRALTEDSEHFLSTVVHAESGMTQEVSADEGDDEAHLLFNSLLHCCSVHINVSALKSGLHQHVHGHLRIDWPTRHVGEARKPSVERHFKVLDRTVTVFAKGTSAAVL